MNLELCKQLAEVELTYKTKVRPADRARISSSRDAFVIFNTLFNPDTIEHHEHFYVLLLNRANRVLGWAKTSEGGTAGTVVDLKIIMQLAIKCNASGIVIAHNHPSGNLVPSEQDKAITRKIKDGAKLFDITLLDHLIVTHAGYYSFSDEGIM